MVPKQIIQILFLNSLSTALLRDFPLFFRLRILAAHLPDVPLKEPDPLLAEGNPPSRIPARRQVVFQTCGRLGTLGLIGLSVLHGVTRLVYSVIEETNVQTS